MTRPSRRTGSRPSGARTTRQAAPITSRTRPTSSARCATIKQYKAITVGKYYHREAPAFGARSWQMSIPGTPTGGPFGKNALIYHDELLTTEIGQIQHSVRRSRPHRRQHLQGSNDVQRPHHLGQLRARRRRPGDGHGPDGRREHRRRLCLPSGGAGCGGLQKIQGSDSRQRRNASDPEKAGDASASSLQTTSRA